MRRGFAGSRRCEAAGRSDDLIAKSLNLFFRNKDDILRQSRLWGSADLESLSRDLLAADAACKTTGAPDTLIAERLTLTIAAKARRLGG